MAPFATSGINYGWDNYEGNHCYNDPDSATNCSSTGLTFPVYEYPHAEGCSVTGGYVYRGNEFPDLAGHYFFADYCRGELRSFKYESGTVSSDRNWTTDLGAVGAVTSFAVDNSDRLYIMNASGDLMRLAPSS